MRPEIGPRGVVIVWLSARHFTPSLLEVADRVVFVDGRLNHVSLRIHHLQFFVTRCNKPLQLGRYFDRCWIAPAFLQRNFWIPEIGAVALLH
jgi:uncharacterized membrane protein